MHRGRQMLLMCLALAASVALGQRAITLIDGSSVEEDVCYSSTGSLRIAQVSLQELPSTERIVLFDQLDVAPKITVSCIHYLEIASAAPAAPNDPACAGTTRTFLCSAAASGTDWACEELFEYSIANVVDVVRGTINGDKRRWRIEMAPGARAPFCYPREVQLVGIIRTDQPVTGSVALLVVVGIILGCIAVCVIVGAVFSFGRQLDKRQRDEAPMSIIPHPDVFDPKDPDGTAREAAMSAAADAGAYPGLDGEFAPQPLPLREVRALYLATPDGQGSRFISTDGTVGPKIEAVDHFEEHVRHSAALNATLGQRGPTPYASTFRETTDGLGQQRNVQPWSPQEHPDMLEPSTVVPIDVLERVQRHGSPRRFNPLHNDGGGTLVCADCEAVVQQAGTPRICPQSGRRHY